MRLTGTVEAEVAVIGSDGKPVAGAIVTERVDLSDWPVLTAEERDARQFEFLPRVVAVTDALGIARVPVLPVRAWIQASAGGQSSNVWRGAGPRHVTLRLAPTCEVEGHIVDETGEVVPAGGSVSCQLRSGFESTFLALVPVRAGGAFGPIRLPLASDDGFVLQYFGGNLEAAQQFLAAPAPDSRSRVEIRTRPGIGVELTVVDEDDHPLAGATAATQWSRNDQWNRIDWRADSKGHVRLTHLPSGEVYVRVRKPGYVPELKQLFRTEEWATYPLVMKLRRAATVRGKCLQGDQPVQSFTVFFFTKEPRDGGKIVVENSDEGRFVVDEAPPGVVQLFATCDEVVQTPHVGVSVDAGAVGQATLVFSSPRTVTGQIVDAASGDALPTARVSAMLISARSALRPWKTARAVDEAGRFELVGFGAVEGRLQVEAPGYALRHMTVWPEGQQRIDVGKVALHRSQSLTVQIRAAPGVDLTGFSATLSTTARYVPGVRFGADGIVRFSDMAPGEAQVLVNAANGDSAQKSCRIKPGGNNICQFEFIGPALDIDVVPMSGRSLPDGAALAVGSVDRFAEQVDSVYMLPQSGHLHIEAMNATRLVLQVTDATGSILATKTLDVPKDEPRKILFEMNASPQRLKVVGPTRDPIPGAFVVLKGSQGAPQWFQAFTTDEKGEVVVPDIGSTPVSISAFHVDFGAVPCAPLSSGDVKGDTIEIVMPRGLDVDVELREGADVLHGVEIELGDSCGSVMSTGRSLAGPDGRVHLSHLAPGDYRILVDHPGIWRTEQPITVTPTSTSFVVQLRRLGSARIRAKSGVGNPVEGVSVELVDVATGARVADWIEKGEVGAPPNGMRTDASGALVVHGLPRGSYRCVITPASGAALERTIDVPAQGMGELEVVVP